jgi:hypothetical protein
MCTPSSRPGAGFVDPELWENRESDPTSLRLEFNGMKGRDWLMKWLPARAYDNGIYVVFSNPIGMDDDQLKNGCSMIIDPFGDILNECQNFEDSFVSSVLTKETAIGRRLSLPESEETRICTAILSGRHTSRSRKLSGFIKILSNKFLFLFFAW